jgi:selenium metabolism protein YedF
MSEYKIVNAKGKACPLPLIMTKKALLELEPGESLKILLDSENALKNVVSFLNEQNCRFAVEEKVNVFEIFVDSPCLGDSQKPKTEKADNLLCDYVVAIQKNYLGEGDRSLGELLIKAFVNTLPENPVQPAAIVFLNSGIFLALEDSPVKESLKKLEEKGTRILSCGTCLDFYKKKEELGVGKVSNMYEIVELLSRSSHVLYP